MFKIDSRDIKDLERELELFARKALPFATKQTLNEAAFTARKISQDIIGAKMIQRNKFTKNSVRVETTKTLHINRQEAVVGSVASYMEVQEFGGQKVKTGKHGVAIPTSEASGEGPKAFPRRKMVRKANKLGNMKFTRTGNKGSRKQRNRIAMMQAVSTGRRFIFLDLGRRSGIYRVMGGKRKPKLRMMYDLSRGAVNIPKRPWLEPAFNKAQKHIPSLYKRALEKQLRRRNILR